MITALVVVGVLCQALAWRLVVSNTMSIWVAMTSILGFAGLAAVLTGRVNLTPRVAPFASAAAGVGAGLVLYAGTVVFVRVVERRWRVFGEHSRRIYGQRGDLPVVRALLLAVGLNVAGEELFWRGLVQGRTAADEGVVVAAVIAWAAYVLVNLPSANLAIVAGAIVGGAAWGGLAAWTGGVLAPLLSHAVWTSLMIARPPVPGEVAR